MIGRKRELLISGFAPKILLSLLLITLCFPLVLAETSASVESLTNVPEYAKYGDKFALFKLTINVGNDQVLAGKTDLAPGTSLTPTNPWSNVYFVDDGDNTWESTADTIFVDDGNVYYDSDETIIAGTTLSGNTLIKNSDRTFASGWTDTKPWSDIFFVDDGTAGWDSGSDAVVKIISGTASAGNTLSDTLTLNSGENLCYYDDTNNGESGKFDEDYDAIWIDDSSCQYNGSETVIAGTTPSSGTSGSASNPFSDILFVDDGTAGWDSGSDAVVKIISGTASAGNTLSDTLTLNEGEMLYYYDGGTSGTWESDSDAIVIDDGKVKYDSGEQVLKGTTPDENTVAQHDNPWAKVKFYDYGNDGGNWDGTNDAIVLDADDNNYYLDVLQSVVVKNWGNGDNSKVSVTLHKQSECSDTALGTSSYDSENSEWDITNINENLNSGTNEFYVCAEVVTSSPDDTGTQVRLAMESNAITLASGASNTAGDSVTFTIDNTPPTTTASATDANGNSYTSGSWTNADVTVTLSPSDGESGVAETRYVILDGEVTCPSSYDQLTNTYSSPISITANPGEVVVKTICYASKDNVGNVESIQAFVVKIDKKPPSITFSMPQYVKNLGTISAQVEDNDGSGIATVELQISYTDTDNQVWYWDGTGWTTTTAWLTMTSTGSNTYTYDASSVTLTDNETYTISIRATDNVDNQLTAQDTTTADLTQPTITFNYGTYTTGTWTNQDISVTVTVTDTLSGVQTKEYAIVTAGTTCGGSLTYSTLPEDGVVTISAEGKQQVCIHAVDSAGNEMYQASEEIWIDKTTPTVGTITITPLYDGGTTKWVPEQITISASVSDSLSGVSACKYTADGSTWNDATYNSEAGTCTADISLSGNTGDTFAINIKAIDQAGNEAQGTAVTVTLDKDAPSVRFNPNSQTWTNQNIEVTISANDGSGSSVQTVYYTVVGKDDTCPAVGDSSYGSSSDNPVQVTISDEGEWKICAYAVDNVGNYPSSATESGVYQIDKTPPVLVSITQLNLTHVVLQFSEEVKPSDGSFNIKLKNVKVWDRGTVEDSDSEIHCNAQDYSNTFICEIEKPITEGVEINANSDKLYDRAGNEIDYSSSLDLENAADVVYEFRNGTWEYFALEREADLNYGPYQEFLHNTNGVIMTYMGEWTTTFGDSQLIPWHPLIGYVIKIQGDKEVYYMPVKFRESYSDELLENHPFISLASTWNLIGVVGDSDAYDVNATALSPGKSSIESLAVPGVKYYSFVWIFDAITHQYTDGNSQEKLGGFLYDMRPYWVFMPYREQPYIYALPVPPRA